MRKIIKIAGNELRMLFCSPIAWLILIIFVFQNSSSFTGLYQYFLRSGAVGEPMDDSLTASLFTGMGGLFTVIQQHIYLYIPLLTMGLMSREYSSGSVKLLYSSPVTAFQVIMGKYLSMMIYGLVMILSVSVYVVFAWMTIMDFDIVMALSGLLGLYLLICSYAAIGLFMSSLTAYQIVAAMGSFAALTFLNFVGSIGQGIGFIRDITWWLSINGRATAFIEGLIASEELCYFILVIVLFLILSVMKVESHRTKRSRWRTALRYIGVVLIIVVAGFLTSRPRYQLYADVTANQTQTISAESQKILKEMEGPLKITAYTNILGNNASYGLPNKVNSNLAHFRSYIRFKPDIELPYLYYYKRMKTYGRHLADLDDPGLVKEVLKNYKVYIPEMYTPDNLPIPEELAEEGYGFFWRVETADGRHTHLRMFQDMVVYPTEAEISAAMKRLVSEPARVAFLSGHRERQIDNFGDQDYYSFAQNRSFRYALINQGFDFVSCVLPDEGEIDRNVDVLVIADPQQVFTPEELTKIREYIDRGGNMLIAMEPGKTEISEMIGELIGVHSLPGQLLQTHEDYSADLLLTTFTKEACALSRQLEQFYDKESQIVLSGAAALTYDGRAGFRAIPLLVSPDSGSWNRVEIGNYQMPELTPEPGEEERAYVTAFALSRPTGNREQKIVVIGDADCFSNAELNMQRQGIDAVNFSLITETFRWLTDGKYPVDTFRPAPKDTAFRLSFSVSSFYPWLLRFIYPGLLLLAFLILRARRKRG